MTLEWVYGYRCYDTRGSVLYTKPTRDVVFFTGCTVVVRQAGRRSKQGGRDGGMGWARATAAIDRPGGACILWARPRSS